MKKLKIFITACMLMFSASILAAPVDINTADVKTLETELVGVGQSKAQAIVDYRKSHGKFSSINDLVNVKGIGNKIIEKNKEKLVLK